MRGMRLAGVVALVVLGFAPGARAATGPQLSVPQAELAKALECTAGVTASATRSPVLMVPGTTLDPESDFAWNWLKALRAQGIPYCTVRSPGNAMADIQVNGEYITYAIRTMHARTGRKVQVVGHSQGGMAPRWSLRFWPDTRAMVDDLIGLAPSNHGTLDADVVCAPGCAPAFWQQRPRSNFITALNAGQETYAGISYTSVFTRLDEVVVPNQDARTGSSALRTGDGARTNVATQDVCPLNVADHLALGTYDPVGYALAMDALTHDGPAEPARIDRAEVCAQAFQPGVDPATFATDYAAMTAEVATTIATYPPVTAEPSLACYATATCGAEATRAVPPECVRTIKLRKGLRRARVTVDGKRVRVERHRGRLYAEIVLRGRVTVRVRGTTKTGRKVRVVRTVRRCA